MGEEGKRKESVKLTESQMIELIESVIMEQSKEKNIKFKITRFQVSC